MSQEMKEAFEDMLKSVNHIYELREAVYKETGYTDGMFDLMNEIMDGEYNSVEEIEERLKEIEDEEIDDIQADEDRE